jgi:hypothetical protein
MAKETPAEKAIRKALKEEAESVKPKPALGKIKNRIAAKKEGKGNGKKRT